MFAHKTRVADLYRRHFKELVGFLSRRVASPELATDLVQELFARLLAREGSMAAVVHDRGFLYCSVKHLAIEARRSPRWRECAPDAAHDMAAEESTSPEDTVAGRQVAARLLAVVDALPPRCREAFLLHKFECLSYAEVADRLGISVSSVEKHMMHALDACRTGIEPS